MSPEFRKVAVIAAALGLILSLFLALWPDDGEAAVRPIVAHGGRGGAVVETLVVVGIAVVFFAVWLRERRASRNEDQSKPQ